MGIPGQSITYDQYGYPVQPQGNGYGNGYYVDQFGNPIVPIYGQGVVTDDFFTFPSNTTAGDSFNGSTGFGTDTQQYNTTNLYNNATYNSAAYNSFTPTADAYNNPFALTTEQPAETTQQSIGWDGIYRDPLAFMPEGVNQHGLVNDDLMDKALNPISPLRSGYLSLVNYGNYVKAATNTGAATQFGRIFKNVTGTLNTKTLASVGGKFINPVKVNLDGGKLLTESDQFLNLQAAKDNLTKNHIGKSNVASYVFGQQKYLDGAQTLFNGAGGFSPNSIYSETSLVLDPIKNTDVFVDNAVITDKGGEITLELDPNFSINNVSADQFDSVLLNSKDVTTYQINQFNITSDDVLNNNSIQTAFQNTKEFQQLAKIDSQLNNIHNQTGHHALNHDGSINKALSSKDQTKVQNLLNKKADVATKAAESVNNALNTQSVISNSWDDIASLDTVAKGVLGQKATQEIGNQVSTKIATDGINVKGLNAFKQIGINKAIRTEYFQKAYTEATTEAGKKAVEKAAKEAGYKLKTKTLENGDVLVKTSSATLGNVAKLGLSALAVFMSAKQIANGLKSEHKADRIAAGVSIPASIGVGVAAGASAAGSGAVAAVSAGASAAASVVGVAFGAAEAVKYYSNGEWERGTTLVAAMGAGAYIGATTGSVGGPIGALAGAAIGVIVGVVANLFVGKGKSQRKAAGKIKEKFEASMRDVNKNAQKSARKAAKEAAYSGNFEKLPEPEKRISKAEIDKKFSEISTRMSKMKKKDVKKGKQQEALQELEDFLTKVAEQEAVDAYNAEMDIQIRKQKAREKNNTSSPILSGNTQPGATKLSSSSGLNSFAAFANGSTVNTTASSGTAVQPTVQDQQQAEALLTQYLEQNPDMMNLPEEQILEGFKSWLVNSGALVA